MVRISRILTIALSLSLLSAGAIGNPAHADIVGPDATKGGSPGTNTQWTALESTWQKQGSLQPILGDIVRLDPQYDHIAALGISPGQEYAYVYWSGPIPDELQAIMNRTPAGRLQVRGAQSGQRVLRAVAGQIMGILASQSIEATVGISDDASSLVIDSAALPSASPVTDRPDTVGATGVALAAIAAIAGRYNVNVVSSGLPSKKAIPATAPHKKLCLSSTPRTQIG